MPFSSQYNLFFIHIPKAAGSTIEKALDIQQEVCLYKEGKYPKHDVCPQHLTLKELEIICPNIINTLDIFTVVRNPFDRLVSEYCHIQTKKNGWAQKYFNLNFDDFVERALSAPEKERKYNFDGHLETQYSYIIGNNQNRLKIFKFEKLNECFSWLNQKTNTQLHFTHERKSNRDHFAEYFTCNNTIKTVQNFYKVDFLHFDYDVNIKNA